MTYEIIRSGDVWELHNTDGEIVATMHPPVKTPDDIIDVILDDVGVGSPQREALSTILKQDWEFVDDTD